MNADAPAPQYRLRLLLSAAVSLALVGGLLGLPGAGGAARAATTSGNLLTGDTATLAGVGGWTGTNIQQLTTTTTSSGNALVVAAASPGAVDVWAGRTAARAVVGRVYTGGVSFSAVAVPAVVQPVLRWYDRRGRLLHGSTVAAAPERDPVTSFGRATVTGIAPRNAVWVSLGLRVEATRPQETHHLAQPVLTVSSGGSSAVAGPLRTVGSTIVDRHGDRIALRGINRSGAYNTTSPDKLSRHDFERIKAWGGNSVRITVGQYVYIEGCRAYDPATPGIVDQAVTWANELGMLAILDLQWTAPTCDSNGLNPMPDPLSKVFWQQVATRYANAPLVAFDLFNEPHSVSDEVWARGGTATTASGVEYRAVGMKELYDTVRATGAENLVFIGGNDYASRWPSTAPLPGTRNVVYAVHAYNCDAPARCVHGTGSDWLLGQFVEPGRTNPIMVTEFGWPATWTREAVDFNAGVIAFAEKQGWGWMPWTWPVDADCRKDTWWGLVAPGDCHAGDVYQPSPGAMPILQGMQRNR